jgi:hypothetical protein
MAPKKKTSPQLLNSILIRWQTVPSYWHNEILKAFTSKSNNASKQYIPLLVWKKFKQESKLKNQVKSAIITYRNYANYEEYYLLGYNTVQSVKTQWSFGKIQSLHFQNQIQHTMCRQSKASMFWKLNICRWSSTRLDYTLSHPRGQLLFLVTNERTSDSIYHLYPLTYNTSYLQFLQLFLII